MTDSSCKLERAAELMAAFARRTGLTSETPGQVGKRYLWTDAFAVCNWLGLARETGDARHQAEALALVDHAIARVHHVLGRHRPDDERTGWISGSSEAEGEAHPTRGGLRIGKELPERRPGEAFDERLEWDRDGQYFHYLTKWMHALDQGARASGHSPLNFWARELAAAAFAAFTYHQSASGQRRMYWKMSIDLSRSLVPSMGQHDPVDGYISFRQLQATAALTRGAGAMLESETEGLSSMIDRRALATADPLGLGGLLADALRAFQLSRSGALLDEGLLDDLLAAVLIGLSRYAWQSELREPAEHRLAFRELGLAIGLRGVALVLGESTAARELGRGSRTQTLLRELERYRPLGEAILSFWLEPPNQRAASWRGHRDINEVMLATALVPAGFLVLFGLP